MPVRWAAKRPASIVEEHATDGKKALKLTRSYTSMSARQDWTGYDYLKADLYTNAKDPMNITIEVRDAGTPTTTRESTTRRSSRRGRAR